jgi:transcriptional regulator with GAF, ATPase, and Fis domain
LLILTVLNGPQAGARFGVRQGRFTLGRGWMNDLALPGDDHVSTRHAELLLSDSGDWTFIDLGSTNGSAVRRAGDLGFADLRGQSRTLYGLKDGDELHLGDPKAPIRIEIEIREASPSGVSRSFVTRLEPAERARGLARVVEDRQRGISFGRFAARLVQDLSLDQVGRLLAEVLLESFSALNHVALFGPDDDEPELLAHREGAAFRPGSPFAVSRTLLESVRASGEAVVFRDAGDLDEGATVARLQVSSGFCVPLKGPQGEPAGLLVADARGDDVEGGDEPPAMSVEDLQLVTVFADHAGRVIAAARAREAALQALALLEAENRRLAAAATARDRLDGIVGNHPALLDVLARVERVATFPTAVLIRGETGTGKEGIARAVHKLSDRAERSFVAVNCAAIPRELLEAELFGHRKGAFTGADRDAPGLFDEADGGTLFLDEIGEVPPELQVKLLRVLQEGEFFAVGDRTPTQVDVRIVAATHRDLKSDVAEGRFREDLLYRLDVFPVALPPLRDRCSDVPALAAHFAATFGARFGRPALSLDPAALRRLESEPWPGNIRELSNRIERAVILADGDLITARDVAPPDETPTDDGEDEPVSRGGALVDPSGVVLPMKQARNRFTRLQVLEAMRQAEGVQKKAAELLDLDPGNLSRLLRDLGLR